MISSSSIKLSDCWAKTDPATGKPALTVRDHCLIVGAVAQEVLKRLPPACANLPPAGAATLAAAHDIGKITPGFLRKCAHSVFHTIPGSQTCESNHAKVGQAFLASLPEMQDSRGNPLAWTLPVDGHHGTYSISRPAKLLGNRYNGIIEGPFTWPDALRRELLAELVQRFGPFPSGEVGIGAVLHWLTGCITFSDWIGSNADWFPLFPAEQLADHIDVGQAGGAASRAVAQLGWHRRDVRPSLSFPQLFGDGFTARPLQEHLVSLADAPGLYIVEAPMGVGKTEAALATAYRRWTEGSERGLYFALPTQLTSNRIHDRVAAFLQNVVADETVQSLCHGNAWLREDRVRAFRPACTIEARSNDDPSDASDACLWFASNRRSLLAPFGSGTVDQALMARIAARHSALRLFALSGKVVVIDEVHSYDAYTAKLVDHLTAWLLETGCTVIVLSATLTERRRSQLVKAIGGSEPSPAPTAYPLITKVSGGKTSHHPVDDPSIRESTVRLEHLHSHTEESWQRIADAARDGACVLVIRNTVALAQETFRRLRSAVCGDDLNIGLLHSRFPHFRRQDNEGEWMRLLGKNQNDRPTGCILVATQVVEQSVDIDADLLVTDLAPTDLLLQRLGRLHRHERPRPEGFGRPVCWILHPEVDWSLDLKSIKQALGPVAFVYPPFALYQAERVWKERRSVRLPAEIRPLLEAGDLIAEEIPAGAAGFREELEKLTASMFQAGSRQDPFRQPSQDDIEGAQTRWNLQPSALLVLLREPPAQRGFEITITPLRGNPVSFINGVFSYDLARALHENAARVPAHVVAGAFRHMPDWLRQHMSDGVLGVCQPASTTIGIPGAEGHPYRIDYSEEQGISYQRVAAPVRVPCEDETDSWF